jgi:hypothetical protein
MRLMHEEQGARIRTAITVEKFDKEHFDPPRLVETVHVVTVGEEVVSVEVTRHDGEPGQPG